MAKVTKRHEPALKLYFYLTERSIGDIVDWDKVIELTQWKDSALTTYIGKRKLAPYLRFDREAHAFTVLQDGADIDMLEFLGVFTQANPREYKAGPGSVVSGQFGQRYTLENFLGRGAIASVWRGVSGEEDEPIYHAVKVFDPMGHIVESDRFQSVAKRFLQEAKNPRNLASPHVARYLDHGFFDEKERRTPFIVMELARESVGSLLKREGPLSLNDAARIMISCAQGLEYLHEKKCVHRDVKPANILLMDDGRCVLGDLGVVRWDDLNPAFTKAGTVTKDAVQLGSINYMAPEQQEQARDSVAASDIYSLGVTFLELMTNRVPHAAIIGAGRYAPPTDVNAVNKFVRKMLDCEPSSRPSAENVFLFFTALVEGDL